MLNTRNVSEMFSMKVFTDSGDYFGEVEESIIASNKVHSWRIRATKQSYLSQILGGAKGVIVPHNFVKAIGDVMIISKAAMPSYEKDTEEDY